MISRLTPWRRWWMAGILAVVGCAPGGGGGNTNDNTAGNSNGNSGGNDNVSDSPLTQEQQAAVDLATLLLNDLAAAMAGLREAANPSSYPSGSTEFGECPVVAASRDDRVFEIDFDFGDGCTDVYYGDLSASGDVFVEVDLDDFTVDIDFFKFTLGDSVLDGNLLGDLLSRPQNQLPFAMQVDVNLSTANGLIVGSVTVFISSTTGRITLSEGQFTLGGPEASAYRITLNELVVDPRGNGNLVPESGLVSVEVPADATDETVTVTIEYTEETPADGGVLVTVGDADTFEYTLIFFAE